MNSQHACSTDNWAEVKAAAERVLGEDLVAFIEQCRAEENPHSQLIAVLHRVQGKFGYLGQSQLDAVAQLLLHLEGEPRLGELTRIFELQGLVDFRHLVAGELNVHHRADALNDRTRCHRVFPRLCIVRHTAAAPPTISASFPKKTTLCHSVLSCFSAVLLPGFARGDTHAGDGFLPLGVTNLRDPHRESRSTALCFNMVKLLSVMRRKRRPHHAPGGSMAFPPN